MATALFDSHEHVCDLIDVDGPLLSLYTDARNNWLYLWCDTDRVKVNRWMLFKVSREDLILFFRRQVSLRELITRARAIIILDETATRAVKSDELGTAQEPVLSIKRRFTKVDDPSAVGAYWPSERSFFDPELAEGIDVQQEIAPSRYLIPVDGRWFFKDLDSFSRTYAKIYAFLYATKPQFINSMGERLHGLLMAPWTGGYSRVNLFSNLRRGLPALHDLQIERFNYASPGAIEVEALPSICKDVATVVLSAKDQWGRLKVHDRIIDTIIASHKLKKADLSLVSDDELPFAEGDLIALRNASFDICRLIGISDRSEALRSAAPNLIVYAKSVQALLGQVDKLFQFEEQGLLNLAKTQAEAEEDVQASAARGHT